MISSGGSCLPRIDRYIEDGKKAGAKVEIGGEREGTLGYFIQPTIFSNVSEDMKIMREEIFGPVCAIAKFSTEEDAIRVGNTTTYGLAAAVHTKDLNTAIRVANALRAGTVWVYVLHFLFSLFSFVCIMCFDRMAKWLTFWGGNLGMRLMCFIISFRLVGTRSRGSGGSVAKRPWPIIRRLRRFRFGWGMRCMGKGGLSMCLNFNCRRLLCFMNGG